MTTFLRMASFPSTSGQNFSEINKFLKEIEATEADEKKYFEGLASVIAYQHNLCARIDSSSIELKKQVRQKTSKPAEQLQPVLNYNERVMMPQTANCINIEESIAKELWQIIAENQPSRELFQISHDSFKNLLQKRNERLMEQYMQSLSEQEVGYVNKTNPKPKEARKLQIVKDIDLRLPNIINKNEKINEFNPTDKYIMEIDEQLNGAYSESGLNQYYDELKRTENELSISFLDAASAFNKAEDSFKFPSQEILRKSEQYKQILGSISHNSIFVRNGLLVYHREMSALIEKFKETQEKLNKCFAFPEINQKEKDELYQNDLRSSYNHRKILFLKSLLTSKSLFNAPPKWSSYEFVKDEVNFLKKLQELLSDKKYSESLQLIENNLERYSESSKQIQEELNKTKENQAKASKAKDDWARRQMVRIDQKLQAQAHESREETEKLFNEIQTKEYEIQEQMASSISELNNILQTFTCSNLIPHNFEQIMTNLIEKESKKEWLLERIQNAKDEIRHQEQVNSELRKELQYTKDKIIEKQKLYKDLQNHDEADDDDDEYHKLKEMYLCSCGENPRDTIITKCGHTYCKICIENRIHARNRKCNYCGQRFDCNTEVVPINWKLNME